MLYKTKLKRLDSILNCPYHKIISKVSDIDNPKKTILTRCCRALRMLKDLGFPLGRTDVKMDEVPGLIGPMVAYFESTAVHLAVTIGNFNLVKTLVELEADPLEKIYPNGETLIHVLKIFNFMKRMPSLKNLLKSQVSS